jgi:hypothetical protein
VATLGLLKKMAHIYFHQIENKKLTHSTFVVTHGKNEVVEKDGPNLLKRLLIL